MSKILVTKPYLPPFEEYVNEIKGIWDNHYLTNFGPLEQKLTEELKSYLGVKHLNLFVNGHQALLTALSCMKLKGEVITTPFTFASTTHTIAGSGLTPVFADVDPMTYTITPENCEKLVNKNTCAILPVHVYGTPCDVEGFERLSRKYGIPVIYDGAHCFGETLNGKGMGSFGKCTMFSFHATKGYNSIEGGAVATDDEELSEKLKEFANFGLRENDAEFGTNAKMNEFSAAMGLCNLRHIDEIFAKRRAITEKYIEIFKSCDESFDEKTGIFSKLHIKVLPRILNLKSNYAYFPVVFDKEGGCKATAKEVMDFLEKEDILTRRYFYPLTSLFTPYKSCKTDGLAIASKVSENVLSMPIYYDLELKDVEKIARKVLELI